MVLPGFGVTITAEYRLVTARLKWDLGLLTALRAGGRIHLPGTPATASITTTTLCFPGLPARGAPLRFVGETFRGIKFLLFDREGKGFPTIGTLKGLFSVTH